MLGKDFAFAVCLFAFTSWVVVPMASAQEIEERIAPSNWTHEQAVEFNRLNDETVSLVQNGDWEKVLPIYERLCSMWPTDGETHENLGIAYGHLGDNKRALQELKQGVALSPKSAEAANNLAQYYLLQADLYNARVWLQRCIAVAGPSDARLVSRTKATLAALGQPRSKPGEGDKYSADYFDSLSKEHKILRWPNNMLPLKVFFEPASATINYRAPLKPILVSAFDEWIKASNGKLSWIETHRKDTADIVCRWQGETKNLGTEGGYVEVPGDCVHQDANGEPIMEHATLTIYTMQPRAFSHVLAPINDIEAKQVCLHEVGHVLGLHGHSSNQDDIMFFIGGLRNPQTHLSQRDKNTIARVYKNYP